MIDRATVLSEDQQYRFTLWREWADDLLFDRTQEGFINFICLNPSTADEKNDDATIRRLKAFTKEWDYSAFCVTNLFAFRSTSPEQMKDSRFPIGQNNDQWIERIAKEATLVVCAWGNHGLFNHRGKDVYSILESAGIIPHFLRLTKHQQPGHPLYVPLKTPPTLWLHS